jgi:hypothetical protein
VEAPTVSFTRDALEPNWSRDASAQAMSVGVVVNDPTCGKPKEARGILWFFFVVLAFSVVKIV